MNVLSAKRIELLQTMDSLIGHIRDDRGCTSCNFCQSMENENVLFLISKWDTPKNLKSHMESKHFSVIRGMMNLLKEPYEIMYYTAHYPIKMDELNS